MHSQSFPLVITVDNAHTSAMPWFTYLSFLILLSFAPSLAFAAEDIVANFGWTAILPSLVAIGVAFATRQVFISLFLGIWLGAFLIEGSSFMALWDGLLRVGDIYLIRALVPEDGAIDHMSVVMFTLIVGGTIGIISANGGMQGVVGWLSKFASDRKRGQFAAFGMGFVVFFDDYANTLIVGKTLRPLTDRLKISREKLAFIVDSTAAPLACIALVTTWIGFQLSLVDDAIGEFEGLSASAYELFLGSLAFSFYPIFMLIFIAMIIFSRRDFGAMYAAEKAAQLVDLEDPYAANSAKEEAPTGKAFNAAIPILTLIVTTIAGLFLTGEGEGVREILGSADPFKAMLWASLISLVVAFIITLLSKSLTVEETVMAMERGFKPMLLAVMILTFAWAIADINKDLGTANYVVSLMGDSIAPAWIPVLVFIIAALTSFATGSSWGTMAILVPLVMPLSWAVVQASGVDSEAMTILYAALASVMAGAVWGDHCSPISDTTILSSIASDCPHMSHVRTQMPYAMTVAGVSIICGLIPAGFGVPSWILLPIGIVVMWGLLRHFGKKV